MTLVVSNRGLEFAAGNRQRAVPLMVWWLAALSPVMHWYWLRLDDGSDEPFGLLVLALAAALAWRDKRALAAGARAQSAGALLLLGSALAVPQLPPLLRAALAVTGVAVFCGLHRRAGLLGLLWLSLPVAASLQFFLGYPLRVVSAAGAAAILEGFGHPVSVAGAEIRIDGQVLGVDPACSGVRMLWHAGVAAMALAALHRLGWWQSAVLGVLALGLLLPVNSGRAALLALQEIGPWRGSTLVHAGVGLLCFVGILAPLWWLAARWAQPQSVVERRPVASPLAAWLLMAAGVLAPALALATPRNLLVPVSGVAPEVFEFDGITLPLADLPESAAERAFAKSFPGRLSSHRWGDRQVVLREVTTATRRLHPSRDCLRAAGFATSEAVTVTRGDGSRWSRFSATRSGERLEVLERVVSLRDGTAWTDVTAWFWHALRHPLNGPWRAETVISR